MNNRILILGASGQLGRYFVTALSKNNNVLATDITKTTPLNCAFTYLDVLDYENLAAIVKRHRIEVIYNLAAILSAKGEVNPFKTWEVNTQAFLNVAKISLATGVKKIFWPSSIAVFGHNSKLDCVANDVPMLPSSIYGVSKLACEKLMFYFNTKHGLDIRSLRYPGIVAAAEPGGGTTDFIVEMLYSAAQNRPYTCFLKPNRMLPMLHIKDAVTAAVLLMGKQPPSIAYPYNISGFETSPETWQQQIDQLGYRIRTQSQVDFRDTIAASWPKKVNDRLFRNNYNWHPKYDATKTAQTVLEELMAAQSHHSAASSKPKK